MEKDKKFKVVWSETAQDYFMNLVLSVETVDKNPHTVDKIMAKIDSLEYMPMAGKIDQIWSNKTVSFRQVEQHPFRVIYHLDYRNSQVFIDYVLDSRKLVAN